MKRLGIIPAHAGLTHERWREERGSWDHPRACGAHMAIPNSTTYQKGSSPRMRGSHPFARVLCIDDGIIPAHAGLTAVAELRQHRAGDHPRACGAHLLYPA